MKNDFQPEIGQFCWSSTPWQKYQMDEIIQGVIMLLGELIAEKGLCDNEYQEKVNPTANSRAGFANDVFTIRSYCWCDGTAKGHENGCPPNFVYKGFSCCWYKWCGRSPSMSHGLPPLKIVEMLLDCLSSLGYSQLLPTKVESL